jgi:hypothetical protein
VAGEDKLLGCRLVNTGGSYLQLLCHPQPMLE